jgi:hypothetical protein
MSFKVGEAGKTLRVATGTVALANGFDMSSYTELTLTFTLPDSTTATKTQTGGEVTLGAGAVTDADLGDLAANEYVEYDVEPSFLSQAGTWKVYLTYTNTTPAPDDIFIGDCVTFTVSAICP